MTTKKKSVVKKSKNKGTVSLQKAVEQDSKSVIPPTESTDPVQAESKPVLDELVLKGFGRLLIIAVFLGWLYDYLFWKQNVGINFAIFLVACLLGGGYWLGSSGIRPAKTSLWLVLPFLFFATFSFLRREPLTIFLTYLFSLLSLGLIASSYAGGLWIKYSLGNYIFKFFSLIGDMLTAFPPYLSKYQQVQREAGVMNKRIPVWGLLRGLLFALPIIICFGSLLAAGDLVFKERLNDILGLEDLVANIFRGILILVYAYLLAGILMHSALKSRDENILNNNRQLIKPFLGFTESTVIFGSVSVLFLLFVIVQFQYFFGGETNIGVSGYTYSQYARRGFNELVTVAFFSLVLILGLSSLTLRENEIQKRTYSILSVILVALVVVILASAYQRISLAIDWHGFSRLRLYPRFFLIWLGLLLAVVATLEFLRKERHFAFAAVLASIGFVVTLILVNVDAATVQHNVPRTLQGKNLNVAHMASLSTDSIPALAEEFYSEAYPQEIHEGIGAALTCYLNKDSSYEKSLSDWRSFDLSYWQAYNALQGVEKYLQDYGINDEKSWDLKVRTPSNKWYDCTYWSNSEEE
jgi:hypothetical protein